MHQIPPAPLAGFKGPTPREGRMGRKGKGEERERKSRGKEGRERRRAKERGRRGKGKRRGTVVSWLLGDGRPWLSAVGDACLALVLCRVLELLE